MSKEKINHPKHYKMDGGLECIDEMLMVFGKEALMHFCLLNAWKYRYRAQFKGNKRDDLNKANWYLKKYSELCDFDIDRLGEKNVELYGNK